MQIHHAGERPDEQHRVIQTDATHAGLFDRHVARLTELGYATARTQLVCRWGREVQPIFVVRGKLLSKSLLFDMALAKACTAARLVDSAGKATITAHRFRHTIGTQLAEGGARIQTIMAVLGHRTPNMSIIYASLSDPTVKQLYQDAMDRNSDPTSRSLARPRTPS